MLIKLFHQIQVNLKVFQGENKIQNTNAFKVA